MDVGRGRAAAVGYGVRLVRVTQGPHGHAIGIAIGHGSREGEGAVAKDVEVVTVVILQVHVAGHPGDRAANGKVVDGAGDGYSGNVGCRDQAGSAGHAATPANRLGEDGHAEGAAVGDLGGKGEDAVGRKGEIIGIVVSQHHGAGKPGDRAAHGVRIGGADNNDVGDVGPRDGACARAHTAGLLRGLRQDGDVVGAVLDGCGKGEDAIGRKGKIIAIVVLQNHGTGKPGDRAANGV